MMMMMMAVKIMISILVVMMMITMATAKHGDDSDDATFKWSIDFKHSSCHECYFEVKGWQCVENVLESNFELNVRPKYFQLILKFIICFLNFIYYF